MESFPFTEQLRQVRVVDPLVLSAGKSDDLRPYLGIGGMCGRPAPVAVDNTARPLALVGSDQPPHLPIAHADQGCSLRHPPKPRAHPPGKHTRPFSPLGTLIDGWPPGAQPPALSSARH